MDTNETKTGENRTNGKQRWKRPEEKEEYTEAEMRLIETSRAVMAVIRKQKARGDFDEYLNKESSNEENAKI